MRSSEKRLIPFASETRILLAFVLAFTAQFFVEQQPYAALPWIAYAISCALLLSGVPRRPAAREWAASNATPDASGPPVCVKRYSCRLLLGALAAALVGFSLGTINALPAIAAAAWMFAIASASIAFTGRRLSLPHRGPSLSRGEFAAIAAILLLAAAARFAWIAEIPGRYFDDESRVGLYLVNLFRVGTSDYFDIGWNAWPIPGLALQGALLPFGDRPTTQLRLVSAAMGTLAVLGTYLCGRALFGPRAALLAALLLAINRTAIDLSRLGTCHAQVMALAPLAFAAWWTAVRSGRAVPYLWTGVLCGLSLYTYNAGQLIPAVWFTWVVLAAVVRPRQALCYGRGALLALLVLSLLVAPLAYNVTDGFRFGGTWETWTGLARDRQVLSLLRDHHAAGNPTAISDFVREQVTNTWLGFFAIPSKAYELGFRNGGIADGVSSALFLLGLALCAFGRRGSGGAFVAVWWAIMAIAAGILTRDPPVFARLVALLPAFALLAAVALDELFRRLCASRVDFRGACVALVVLLATAGFINGRTYFVEFANQRLDFTSLLARHLHALPRDRTVVLSGAEYVWHPAGWWSHALNFEWDLFPLDFATSTLRQVSHPSRVLPLRGEPTGPVTLLLGPTQLGQLESVLELYPDAVVVEVGEDLHRFLSVDIPVVDLERQRGLELSLSRDEETRRLGTFDPQDPDAEALRTVAAAHPESAAFEWQGSVHWPNSGADDFVIVSPVPFEVTLAGASYRSAGTPPRVFGRVELAEGWHPFRLRQRGRPGAPWRMRMGSNVTQGVDFRPDHDRRGLIAEITGAQGGVMRVLDPQVNWLADRRIRQHKEDPFAVPAEVQWRGWLAVEAEGRYEFALRATGSVEVYLDGQPVLASAEEHPAGSAAGDPQRFARHLDRGRHALHVSWKAASELDQPRQLCQLAWTPPGGREHLVPPSRFEADATVLGARVLPVGRHWCATDCDQDGVWTVDEIILVASIALGSRPARACPFADASNDGAVTVDELVAVLSRALEGCSVD